MATSTTSTSDSSIPGVAAPAVDAVKGLARKSPWAFAALAMVVGIATINTLRGK